MRRRLIAEDIGPPDFTEEQMAEWLRCKGCSCGLIKDQEHADIEVGRKRVVEAGALIITPDEKLVERIAEVIYQQVELHGVTYDRVAQAVLDALRDAMPPEDANDGI